MRATEMVYIAAKLAQLQTLVASFDCERVEAFIALGVDGVSAFGSEAERRAAEETVGMQKVLLFCLREMQAAEERISPETRRLVQEAFGG